MEIKDKGSFARLSWNGTQTKLSVLSVDGRLCFEGESPQTSKSEYFLRIDSLETLELVMNFMETMGI